MSEERLERALQAMRNESVSSEELEDTRTRVLRKLSHPGSAACAEFQAEFEDYLNHRTSGARRMLLEDHLSRCPSCRARLSERRGIAQATEMQAPRSSRKAWRWAWAIAAVVLLGIIYLGRHTIDSRLAPRGPRATVASVTGGLYLVTQGALKTGSTIGENQVIRTGPGAHAVLQLTDGSRVEINERTELSIHARLSGKSIRLLRGDIIVHAARQRFGTLSVHTRDTAASVKGTIFAVSTGLGGTLVSVVEGSVEVIQSGAKIILSAGEQIASNPALTGSIKSALSWSPDAETYLATLSSLAKIEKEIAALPAPSLQVQSSLIRYMPQGMLLYGAAANPGHTIEQALMLAEQQALDNPAFNQWWNSGPGDALKNLAGRLQTLAPLLGDEIVYGFFAGSPGKTQVIPLILAEVTADNRNELEAALNNLAAATNAPPLNYHLGDSLLAVSSSAENLKQLLTRLGQGASTPFAEEIALHYQAEIRWLLAVDMDAFMSLPGMQRAEFIKSQGVKYIFVQRHHGPGGIEENEFTIVFHGPRKGLASLPANSGSGGAAEYISSDAAAAFYISTREPRQLLEELLAQISRSVPSFQTNLAMAESRLGISLTSELAGAFGTESAFAIEGFSLAGPAWTLAVVVNDPATLERSLRRLIDICNADMERSGQTARIQLQEEILEGRNWTSLSVTSSPFSVTWTYDRGYLLAGSDRGLVTRALGIPRGGSPLVWSAAFQQQLPISTGLNPAGFAWLNTRGALKNLATLMPIPSIEKLLAERDPILIVFNGSAERIRVASRTRLSGLLMDLLLLRGAGRMRAR